MCGPLIIKKFELHRQCCAKVLVRARFTPASRQELDLCNMAVAECPSLLPAMQGRASKDQLLGYFDSLPALEAEQLIGFSWKGGGCEGQPATTAMHVTGWWGKLFFARNRVEALVHECPWSNPVGLVIRLLFFWRQVHSPNKS